ncbi:VanZ family protein [Candidatus Hydrogenedentota bacterium]
MKKRYSVLTLLYCAAIFWSSSRNLPDTSINLPFADKLVHFCIFGGLSLIAGEGILRGEKWKGRFAVYVAPIIFALLYGASDEIHQCFVDGRTPSLADLVMDVAGAITAQFAVWRARTIDAKKMGVGQS